MKTTFAMAAAVALAAAATGASARDQIRIVGSSTVFPYTQAVAEEFANKGGKPPVVESTGTGGGMKLFCAGVGEQHPDITGASRAMTKGEFADCEKNGVTSISEVLVGFDGLSLAMSRAAPDFNVTKGQLFLALGATVPVNGQMVPNPYKMWSEIDPSLPAKPILVYGPPPTSGTRDAWVELAMHEGCKELPFVKEGKFDSKWINDNCSRMRQDGPFVEAGENDNLIVQRLTADANAMGIFGYSFLYENSDKLKGAAINGVLPSEQTVATGDYKVSRPLFFYIKNAHRDVIPGFENFVLEYVSDASMGAGGYLQERGLVPLSPERLKAVQDGVKNRTAFKP
jgi:phosphate transport system substrate-binding protein